MSASVSTALSALERQSGEVIEAPWVSEQVTLVAGQGCRIAAAHPLRYFVDARIRWRNALVKVDSLQDGAYDCALGSMASEPAEQDEQARASLAQLFRGWEELLASTAHDIRPMEIALDRALEHLRSHLLLGSTAHDRAICSSRHAPPPTALTRCRRRRCSGVRLPAAVSLAGDVQLRWSTERCGPCFLSVVSKPGAGSQLAGSSAGRRFEASVHVAM
jgi:hypothetical protein